MLVDQAKSTDVVGSQLTRTLASKDKVAAGGVFTMQCFDKEGNLKWEAKEHNLVVNGGLQDMNEKYFKGSGYTATWYIGIYGSGATNTPAAGDTAASHVGWTEVTPYSNATRPTATFGTATTADPSVINNASSPAQFNIDDTAVVGGAFLISDNTKGGTTGVLFSASDFAAPGDRSVASGDTLNILYEFSLNAA
jgi:hypothetical protein